MPVYIRKNVSYTPPSLDKLPQESEDDYVNDPELLKDILPQPYRMIDKTLRELIDDSWEVIAEREKRRLEEASKVRPPQYESSVELEAVIPATQYPEKQKFCYSTCMTNSPDGQYIFVGLPCGLVVTEAATQQTISSWEAENAEMSYIKSYTLAPQVYMITTIDDMGVGRLFAFSQSANKLFLVKVLNSQESDNKLLVSKIEASTDGDYMGVVMENPSSHDMWLEVHKLPKDTWVSDLETITAAIKKKEDKEKKEEAMSEMDAESVAPSDVAPSKADTDEPSVISVANSVAPLDTAEQSQSRPASGKSLQGSESNNLGTDPTMLNLDTPRDPLSGEYKFGSPQLVMKVKPSPPLAGSSVANLLATCQKVESNDVIGTGHNLLFTQAHLDLRQSVFDHIHDNLLKYLPEDDENMEKLQQYPNFHFLTAGRMLPQGLEQVSLEGRPTTVAVWWPGSTTLMQYSLIKTSKDIEFKPDLVWPFTCKITSSEVSPDTNVIAIGLENGNLVVWDRHMGTQRGVVNVQENSPVVQIRFLDPALYPQDPPAYPPYPTSTGTYILVMCANSALYTVSTGTAAIPLQVNTISLPVENDNDTITVLQPFDTHPDMLLTVTRKGDIQIRDTLQGTILCEIQLPSTHELSSPWDPVLAVGGQGQNMYVKGNQKPVDEESSEIDADTSLQTGVVFVYQLRSFPSLDQYWKIKRSSQPFTVHTTIEERVDSLLAERIALQAMRKNRMQDRWAMLKDEINNIHSIKEIARINATKRNIVTPGSVGLPVKPLV
ncbi:WD repeat-containing protein 93-like isoform X3 [Ruditapes philippinarum]|uniref:WD repeat-containing protein 93-like isoform X3 n=1 Tax=Ruditapes philippinarum TaxID=129788 RepID=UPI00295A91FA|nr:WD repeat-containing protein 93-like isoform X3 [Ruditapes philippinarum]